MRKCGSCGQLGHNRRTCPDLQVEEVQEEVIEVVPEKPKKKKRTIKCNLCNEKNDHKTEQCPYKPIAEDVVLGPDLMECGHFSWWLKDNECEICNRMKNLKERAHAD